MNKNNSRKIRTGQTDDRVYQLLLNIEGQMSDGMWENTPGYERYWQHSDIIMENDEVLIEVDDYYKSGFRDMNSEDVRRFFARRIRKMVKEYLKDYKSKTIADPCKYINWNYDQRYPDQTILSIWCMRIADELSRYKEE